MSGSARYMRSTIPLAERARTLARLRKLVWLLDNSIKIPGTRFTIGLDPIIGLAPGIGDALMLAASAYIVYEARRLGATPAVLRKMIFNILIDTLAGTVPLAGDLFDAGWKANQRNLALLSGMGGPAHDGSASPAVG